MKNKNIIIIALIFAVGVCFAQPVFAQVSTGDVVIDRIITDMENLSSISDDIKGLEKDLNKLEQIVNNPKSSIDDIMHLNPNINATTQKINMDFNEILHDYRLLHKRYCDYIPFSSREITDKRLLLAYRYLTKDKKLLNEEIQSIRILFPKRIFYYDYLDPYKDLYNGKISSIKHRGYWKIDGKRAVSIYRKDLSQVKLGLTKMKDSVNEMKNVIALIEQAKAEIIRETFDPIDIMEYAYKNGMLPKEKAGVKLALEAMDADVFVSTISEHIMSYLREFGSKIKNIESYNITKFSYELTSLPISKRTEYIEEITGLEKGSKTFVEDVGKLDRYSKRYVGRNITKGFWVLAGLGAIATAAYITDVAADNHFSKNTISPRELGIIAKNIENGTATIREKFAFFTHPATEEYVKKDPVYTLSLVQLSSDIYAADELLKEVQKAQEQETNDKVEQGVIKNIDKQIGTAVFGVGSL